MRKRTNKTTVIMAKNTKEAIRNIKVADVISKATDKQLKRAGFEVTHF